MEKELKIPIPKTKLHIDARQRGPLTQPVVVFVHGLTGHMDEHIFFNGARYFEKKGFSSLRFNQYGYGKDTRKLVDSTLRKQADDLDLVIKNLHKKGAKKIFVVGHSYGGPTILFSDQTNYDAIALWDGSYKYLLEDAVPIQGTELRKMDWGVECIIGQAMYEEAQSVPWETLIKKIQAPVAMILAEHGDVTKRDALYRLLPEPKTKHVVKNAGHTFDEDGVEEKLFEETWKWFKQFT